MLNTWLSVDFPCKGTPSKRLIALSKTMGQNSITPLALTLIRKKRTDFINFCFENSFDLSRDSCELAIAALEFKDEKVIRFVLKCQKKQQNFDSLQSTIFRAAQLGENYLSLVTSVVDINEGTKTCNALCKALCSRSFETARLLINHNIDLSKPLEKPTCCLTTCKDFCFKELADFLEKTNCNLNQLSLRVKNNEHVKKVTKKRLFYFLAGCTFVENETSTKTFVKNRNFTKDVLGIVATYF